MTHDLISSIKEQLVHGRGPGDDFDQLSILIGVEETTNIHSANFSRNLNVIP